MFNVSKLSTGWLSTMSQLQQLLRHSSILILVVLLLRQSNADVGTAGHYDPPYTPTACFGYDPLQFPSSFLFAAAGEGIWDNGAACGRQYWVRCISADRPKTCNPAQLVQVRIVDRALSAVSRSSSDRATIVLSKTAFEAIANPSASSVNVEFVQV
ncbi:hypothetical protein ACJRO7_014471 [Eucalyptus globulus]|uniref:Expansin-like EG45 domain-containing protein n=1 Tax=Eucalyptus globulus TaxID=34317 RepID=A0ABD3L680_EUCGL